MKNVASRIHITQTSTNEEEEEEGEKKERKKNSNHDVVAHMRKSYMLVQQIKPSPNHMSSPDDVNIPTKKIYIFHAIFLRAICFGFWL